MDDGFRFHYRRNRGRDVSFIFFFFSSLTLNGVRLVVKSHSSGSGRSSFRAVPSRIANDEARIDKGTAARSVDWQAEAATWNPTARDRKPIVSAALAGQSSEKPRPACLQRRSRKTGTSGLAPTTPACPALRPCRYQDTAETYSGLSAFIID